MGIISNTKAAKVLIAGKNQFRTLQLEIPSIKLDTTSANKAIICLRNGILLSSISIVLVDIPINITNLHIVETFFLFFLCLKDKNRLGIYLNKITNQLIY